MDVIDYRFIPVEVPTTKLKTKKEKTKKKDPILVNKEKFVRVKSN